MGESRFQKIERDHLIEIGDEKKALFVDLHIIHEVTSPQAFSALKKMNLPVRHPENTFAVTDHVVNTGGRSALSDSMDDILIETLQDNCREYGITLYGQQNSRQGICHVVAPEVGLTRPNATIFCGDSHTSTHGAFGTVAAGIGTSNVRDILATGCLLNYTSPRQLKVEIRGELAPHLSAKDLILYLFSRVGNAWATGGAVLFTGEAIRKLSMSGRMTICNMTIEMGGRFGYCDVDETTFEWFRRKRDFFDPSDLSRSRLERWMSYNTDEDAEFDDAFAFDASEVRQMISYGLTLNDIAAFDGLTGPVKEVHPTRKKWEVSEGTKMTDISFNHAFIGSCTNGRLEDFVAAARVLKLHGGKVAVESALAVPGSMQVKKECEALGLHRTFIEAGFEWRSPGCSSCLAMNPDKFTGRVASSTNRNFPGRQGPDSRTYLMSPESVALAALEGNVCNVEEFYREHERVQKQ